MSNDATENAEGDPELIFIVIISIVLALILSISLIIYETPNENFSTLAILPDTYNNFPEENVSPYLMKVQSFEKGPTGYSAVVFINGIPRDQTTFVLNPGEVYEEKKILDISDIQFPAKVLIELQTPAKKYSAYYWLKQNR
ncbi:MAG: hypothetical protein A4E34_00017 [Methanoregula sp. PtaU1.Bin006]|uniref:hypothetical protein n=1 Tax=Methanoregula sp. PtaU1.Bin006 TaxID=1811681 RepID=UPI0009C98AB5|nr:hypothetical protein [Methanoregula sp. PtaU1.Bin006]OPY37224.1 MAG: hypothetical protein A4E34_00017 [Methanoregula sp. PtaU1.Bin006]